MDRLFHGRHEFGKEDLGHGEGDVVHPVAERHARPEHGVDPRLGHAPQLDLLWVTILVTSRGKRERLLSDTN